MNNLKKTLILADNFFAKGEYKSALDKYSLVNSRSSQLLTNSQCSNLQACERVIYGIDDVSKLTIDNLGYPISNYISQHGNPSWDSNLSLVSIVITTHNTGLYIKRCLDSLRRQTYSRLEVIVVDDASSDNSVQIIKEYQQDYSGFSLKLLCLSCNLGTYFAKNYGIKEAKGDYIFFQDSDDFSHEERINLCMHKILKHNWLGIRCEYARVNEHDQIVRVNNYVSKIGLIVLGFHKSVFTQIGYFNPTIKGSDDEFNWRFRTFIGKELYGELLLPLYFALVRSNSLFVDMIACSTETNITQQSSIVRQEYIKAAKDLYSKTSADKCASYFDFPSIRDKVNVSTDMSKLANPKYPVVLNFAINQEHSYHVLLESLDLLSRQCDIINVFTEEKSVYEQVKINKSVNVNLYLADSIPNELFSLRVLQQLKITYGAVYWINLPVLEYYAPDLINFILASISSELNTGICWFNKNNFIDTMLNKTMLIDENQVINYDDLCYWGIAVFSANFSVSPYQFWIMRSKKFFVNFVEICLNSGLKNSLLNLKKY